MIRIKDQIADKENNILDAKGLRFGIVLSEFNYNITSNLFKGAQSILLNAGVKKEDIVVHKVPGAFELIFGSKVMAKNNVDAIICIGSVIEGETKHFDYICQSVSFGIKDLNILLDIPVIFGVLTDHTLQQAEDRSGGKYGNKGSEAAVTAIEMAKLARI